jgi:hypothetical protein
MIHGDPRLQCGAYITDGTELYEVLRHRPGGFGGGVAGAVLLENCRSLCAVQLHAARIRSACRLVRAAPDPRCPDVVEQIVWEPARATR